MVGISHYIVLYSMFVHYECVCKDQNMYPKIFDKMCVLNMKIIVSATQRNVCVFITTDVS